MEQQITIVGNLTGDPELRFTPSGQAVANFSVAATPQKWDKEAGKFIDGETIFWRCSAWRGPAENVAESLKKGDRVIVTGSLRNNRYERDGQLRDSLEIDVNEIGASLRFATAAITKVRSTNTNRGNAAEGVVNPVRGNDSVTPPW
jgi:single-strand DNA-binding protein